MTTKEKLPLLVMVQVNEDRLGRQEGDFPITGGIGEFAGITGDIDFVTDLTGTVVSQSYITCH